LVLVVMAMRPALTTLSSVLMMVEEEEVALGLEESGRRVVKVVGSDVLSAVGVGVRLQFTGV
jgi:hypothetical protein